MSENNEFRNLQEFLSECQNLAFLRGQNWINYEYGGDVSIVCATVWGWGVTNIGETLLMLSKVERFSRGFWFREKELGKGSPYTLSLNIHWKSIGRWCRSWENLYRFCHLNSSWFSLFANLQIVVGEIYILFAINLQSQNNANCDFRRMFLKYLIFIWIL